MVFISYEKINSSNFVSSFSSYVRSIFIFGQSSISTRPVGHGLLPAGQLPWPISFGAVPIGPRLVLVPLGGREATGR